MQNSFFKFPDSDGKYYFITDTDGIITYHFTDRYLLDVHIERHINDLLKCEAVIPATKKEVLPIFKKVLNKMYKDVDLLTD